LKSDIQPYQKIREYLLGKSSSEDSAFVEERLLGDDEFYQQLLVVEDELFDQYLAGSLPEADKGPFENYFLATPERREKLRFTRNLTKYVSRAGADVAPPVAVEVTPTPKRFSFWPNPIVAYSLAAAAVVVVALVGLTTFRSWNAPPHTSKTLAVELMPGLTRGDEGIKQINVTTDTATVELQLRAPNISTYQTYRAILQTIAGNEISRQDNLSASNDRVICPIPATLLKPGDYSLKLSGLNEQKEYEDIARYNFRVTQ
jgi:hypothetical protein